VTEIADTVTHAAEDNRCGIDEFAI